MDIQLTKEQLKEVAEFCEAVSKARATRDAKNGDTGEFRIKREMVGKIGEYAACLATNIGKIDFTIYKTNRVAGNTEDDLVAGVHVKTCDASAKGTKFDGWLISRWEGWLYNPSIRDRMIFCYATQDGRAEVIGWAYTNDLLPFVKFPVSRRLKHKKALYATDITSILLPIEELKNG